MSMDGNDDSGWSAIAGEWAELWGAFGDPVRETIIEATGIGEGSRVLDVGCGSGEFLALLVAHGANPAGVDPAPAMVALAGPRAQVGAFEHLPWPDDTFDVVTAVNALLF